MNCNHTQQNFDEYLDGMLNAEQLAAVESHIESCSGCSAAFEQLRAMRVALRQMPVEPARSGFAQAAMQQARQAHVADSPPIPQPAAKREPFFRHWFAAGFGGAFAAGLALWAVFTVIGPFQPASDMPMFNIAVQQTRNVSLAINVPEDMEDVTLSVELPKNFEISGYRGKQQLAWQTRLKKGRNTLTLPVVALKPGQGQLIARVARDQKSKLLRVNLQAMSADKTSQLVVDLKA
jgi:hypothetical protein